MTLLEKAIQYVSHECRKHELHPDPAEWARTKINNMTNMEFLELLSDMGGE